jgi:hypothetical protein
VCILYVDNKKRCRQIAGLYSFKSLCFICDRGGNKAASARQCSGSRKLPVKNNSSLHAHEAHRGRRFRRFYKERRCN